MREAMLTVPELCLRAYIVCPVRLHNYSPLKTTKQVKGVNSRKNGQSGYKYIYLALGRKNLILLKKNTLAKRYLILTS
jgi:hypothetical protein